jgi:hypothetical protein
MCFSAAASFGLSAALAPATGYCLVTAARKSRSQLPVAIVPLVFGVQQFCEGLVWVGLDRVNETLVPIASSAYLYFALSFWPFWVPLCLLVAERRSKRKPILGAITLLGSAGGLVLYLPLVTDHNLVATRVQHHSIQYEFDQSPVFQIVTWQVCELIYLVVVALPILMAELRQAALIGVVLIVLAVITHYVAAYAFVSLWCFFAAAMSLYLCHHFYRMPMDEKQYATT